MDEIEQILSSLSIEEREAVMTILKEQASVGHSEALQELYSEDYEEMPVDIDTFLESPRYLGNSTNCGTAIYPYWRKAYREIIDQDKVEIAMGGSIGCGKALLMDSLIFTDTGYVEMKDIHVGDKVFSDDGELYDVVGVYPQGEKECYEFTFSDGSQCRCSKDHLWNHNNDNSHNYITSTASMIKNYFDEGQEVYIPIAKPLHYGRSISYDECVNIVALYRSDRPLPNLVVHLSRDCRLTVIKLLLKLSNYGGENIIQADDEELRNQIIFLAESVGGVAWSHTDSHNLIHIQLPNIHRQPYRKLVNIREIGKHRCQCIYVDSPSHLFLTNNLIVTHNTTAAIYLMAYFLYKLMCLKNIRQYFGLEGNGPVCIAFLNNTIQLSKGVAYDKFMSTIATSPWFLERGEVRGTVNLRYKPQKNIEFVLGSSSDQIIGRDIFCLTGDTMIETSEGTKCLRDIENKFIQVQTVDSEGRILLSDKPCKIARTKVVAAIRVIMLQDRRSLRCTFNHRFLMVDMTYKEAKHIKRGDKLFSPTSPEGILVTGTNLVTFQTPIPVYDVLDVAPYHNFIINTGRSWVVSHNCAIQDEVNFSRNADIHFEKNKVLETYNACFGRIKNRFTINGKCQGRIFLVSSKKTEYDFLNQYIERKMKSVEDSKNLYVADAKAFEVKPKGSYSGKMFRVAVGGSNLPSKIPEDTETNEELIHQGYEIYDVPVELRGDFELDINRFIADHLGISVSEVIKFIPYNKLEACYKDITNPVSHEVVMANLSDKIPIETYFKPEQVPEIIYRKPIFVHIDTSGGKTDNTGISAVACMGFVNRNRYSEETGQEETTKQMLYRHVFSLGLNAEKHTEISFQKLVDFLWYLKYKLGWNIKAVSTDGYMGQFLRQQIAAAGFDEVNYVSLDRTPEGYLAFQSILAEERIALIKLTLLETELVRLERNNISGKIDHPLDGCFTGDTKIALADGRECSLLQLKSEFDNGKANYVWSCNENTLEKEIKPITNVFWTKRSKVVEILLDNGCSIRCTPDHKFMLACGHYVEAQELREGTSLMSNIQLSGEENTHFHVVSVESLSGKVDVYDISVQDNPNFALAAGVFVHNSKDIADSLAGALYNATLHEGKLQIGGEDILEAIVEENPSRPLSSAKYKQQESIVSHADVQQILSQLKSSRPSLNDNDVKKVAARQAFIDKMDKEEWEDSQQDWEDGLLI